MRDRRHARESWGLAHAVGCRSAGEAKQEDERPPIDFGRIGLGPLLNIGYGTISRDIGSRSGLDPGTCRHYQRSHAVETHWSAIRRRVFRGRGHASDYGTPNSGSSGGRRKAEPRCRSGSKESPTGFAGCAGAQRTRSAEALIPINTKRRMDRTMRPVKERVTAEHGRATGTCEGWEKITRREERPARKAREATRSALVAGRAGTPASSTISERGRRL